MTNRFSGNLGLAASPWSPAAARVVVMTASEVGGDLGMVSGFRDLVTILMDWSPPHTLFNLSQFTLSTNSLMNVPMISMTTLIPVVMLVTMSIAMYVKKTITHSHHPMKLVIIIDASWPLAASLFVITCMTTTGTAGDHCLLYRFRNFRSTKKRKIILVSSLGVTFSLIRHT